MRRYALLTLALWASASPAFAQPAAADPQPAASDPQAPQTAPDGTADRLAQLEARLNAVEQNAGADNSQEIADLQQDLEDMRDETSDQTNSILEEIANRVTVSGYMHVWLRASEGENVRFRAFRANIIMNAQITSALSFFAEWEFEDAAAIGEGKGVLETERAYMQLALWPALGMRAGIVLVPFGNYNLLHEGWRHAFSTRPLIDRRIFPSTYADIGVELFGTLVDTESVQLRYELLASNGLTNQIETEAGGGAGLRSARPSFGEDNNNGKSLTMRVGLSAGEHLSIGMSGHYGAFQDNSSKALAMAGADISLTYDSFVARAEGLYIYVPNGSRTFDDDGDPTTPDVTSRLMQGSGGGVLEFEYRFFPSFLAGTAFGAFENPKFFLAVRGDAGFMTFPSQTNREYAVTGSFGYRPVPRSAIRFEYLRSFAPDAALDRGDNWMATISFAMGY